MKLQTLIPALIVGLSLSSVAMATKTEDGSKRTRFAKAEKQVRHAKVKRPKKTSLR